MRTILHLEKADHNNAFHLTVGRQKNLAWQQRAGIEILQSDSPKEVARRLRALAATVEEME